MSFKDSTWHNEPAQWNLQDERLRVVTDARTDFWRETHYGFTRDSGHFLGFEAAGPFTAQLRIRARYEALYDQAGIMVRLDESHWIKAGIEWSDDAPRLGSVLTLGRSDWSTGPFDGDAADFWLRVTVAAGVIRFRYHTMANDGLYSAWRPSPTRRLIVSARCAAHQSAPDWRSSSQIFLPGHPLGGSCTISHKSARVMRARTAKGRVLPRGYAPLRSALVSRATQSSQSARPKPDLLPGKVRSRKAKAEYDTMRTQALDLQPTQHHVARDNPVYHVQSAGFTLGSR